MIRSDKKDWIWIAWFAIHSSILIGVVVDVAINLQLAETIAIMRDGVCAKASLPCASIPTRFVLEQPECAQKLLEAMNVTNVRVLPVMSYLNGSEEKIRRWSSNTSVVATPR